jgi:adenylate cyclase
MNAKTSVAHRLGRVLVTMTRQSGRLPETPEYGSWLLGKVSESPRRRRVRIQVIMTVFIVVTNLVVIAVSMLLVGTSFRCPASSPTRRHG